MRIALSLLLALFNLSNGWLKRQDATKLREAGQTKEIARASLALLATLEKAHAIDRALLDDEFDPDWAERLRKRASGDPQ